MPLTRNKGDSSAVNMPPIHPLSSLPHTTINGILNFVFTSPRTHAPSSNHANIIMPQYCCVSMYHNDMLVLERISGRATVLLSAANSDDMAM